MGNTEYYRNYCQIQFASAAACCCCCCASTAGVSETVLAAPTSPFSAAITCELLRAGRWLPGASDQFGGLVPPSCVKMHDGPRSIVKTERRTNKPELVSICALRTSDHYSSQHH